MRFYLAIFFSFISISAFAAVNRVSIDSIKNLITTSNKDLAGIDTLKINRLIKLASGYFDTNSDSSLYYGQKSVDLSRKINYKDGIANGLVQIAKVNYFRGEFANATRNFDEAIGIYKQTNNKIGLSNCYANYSRMYNLLAKYKLALTYLNLALDIDKKLKNEVLLADCLKNIGIIYYSEGQLSNALDYYFKALFINIKIKNRAAAASNYNNIGVVLQSMEVYPKALEYLKKARVIFSAEKNIQGVGVVDENIGEILMAQKNFTHAIIYINSSLKTALKQDDKDGISSLYTDLGQCYAGENQIKQAMYYLNLSMEVASKYKIVYNQANALIGYATVYNQQKNYQKANEFAILGQQYALKLGNVSVRAKAAEQLNRTFAGLKDYENAYKILRQYNDLKDSLNNSESMQKLTSYNLELDFATKERQLAQQQREKDQIYQQRIQFQGFVIAMSTIMILAMIGISVVYYRQKRKQQKINLLLEDKNTEVLQQKTNLDDQAKKLNDLNTLKDRLISILAHDLRAPLSTLRGLFDLLQDQTITHTQMLEMIPGVLKKLEYTSDFLDTLLFWINSQMENFGSSAKNFNIKDIVALEAETYQEQAASKGISLIDTVPFELVASADANSIRIVIRNLITNAIKFTKENDIIEITAGHYDENNQIISVKDSGTGMTEDQLSQLFKSKVNSKAGTNNETGTGMGMLFCKDLVEKSNGKIWVTSKLGKGTKFSFTLPTGILNENEVELVD